LPKFIQHFYTIFIVMIGWVFFKSPDLPHALNYLQAMLVPIETNIVTSKVTRLMESHFVLMSFIFAAIGISPAVKNIALKLMRKNKIFIFTFDLFLIFVLIAVVIRISASTHNPFIYFQF